MKILDMRKMMIALLVLRAVVLLSTAEASRIKELAQLEGVRSNQLVGYGLVVGLNGTGDSSSTQFTIQSLVNMMERLGVTVDPDQVDVANVRGGCGDGQPAGLCPGRKHDRRCRVFSRRCR